MSRPDTNNLLFNFHVVVSVLLKPALVQIEGHDEQGTAYTKGALVFDLHVVIAILL